MPMLNCYVDERTLDILRQIAVDFGRTVEDIAESAISEAAVSEIRAGRKVTQAAS